MLEPRRALSQVSLEPSHRSPLVLGRSALGVEVDELQSVLEWDIWQLARGILGHLQSSALDRTTEATDGLWLFSQTHRFVGVRVRVVIPLGVLLAVIALRSETGATSSVVDAGTGDAVESGQVTMV